MKKRWFIVAPVFLFALFVWFLWPRGGAENAAGPARQQPAQRLQTGAQNLRQAKTLSDSKTAFVEVRAALRLMDTDEARDWIMAQWRGGEDFATKLDLTLDSRQNLSGWPSFRTFLLDMLFQVDPEAAAVVSKDLLGTSESPEEWAVALRNLARVGSHEELLKSKVAELLQRKDWQSEPSAGYLEAFDVIVHTRHSALAPELLANCDAQDEKAVRHASFLTLDRLILAAPEQVLPELAKNASQHPRSGLMISNMIARADVRSAVQRQALETYLLDPKRTAEELRGFASVFPNRNIAVSDNLLTRVATINGEELALKDRASLEAVAAWLADPRFAKLEVMLRQSYNRLLGFLER
jgi:hypothetical protein